LLAFWDPERDPGPVLCLFRRVTGVPCPACGLTRAASLAAHGRFVDAFALHPALPFLALEAGLAWLVWGARLRTGRRLLAGWEMPIVVATALGLVALWLGRVILGSLPT